MTFDDLPASWQQRNDGPLSPDQREEIVARVCRRVEKLSNTIFHRDMRETIAAGVVILLFSLALLNLEPRVSQVGAVIAILGAAHVIYKLHRTRTGVDRPPLDSSVRDFCQIELERLDQQIRLLRSVLGWYIAPLLIGANLIVAGIDHFGTASLVYCVITLVVAWGIYGLNQHAVSTSLVPVRRELAGLLRELDGDS